MYIYIYIYIYMYGSRVGRVGWNRPDTTFELSTKGFNLV